MWTETITAIKDVLLGAAAVTTAIVAVKGLKSWRQELKGKAEFEVARNLIRATYKLRDEVARCRSPMIWGSEFPQDDIPEGYRDATNKSPDKEARAYSHFYSARWAPVEKALQEFEAQALEAEAFWGSEVRAKTDSLRGPVVAVNAAIYAVIEDKAVGGANFRSDQAFGQKMRAAVSATDDKTNEVSQRIHNAVSAIEGYLRQHLRRD